MEQQHENDKQTQSTKTHNNKNADNMKQDKNQINV